MEGTFVSKTKLSPPHWCCSPLTSPKCCGKGPSGIEGRGHGKNDTSPSSSRKLSLDPSPYRVIILHVVAEAGLHLVIEQIGTESWRIRAKIIQPKAGSISLNKCNSRCNKSNYLLNSLLKLSCASAHRFWCPSGFIAHLPSGRHHHPIPVPHTTSKHVEVESIHSPPPSHCSTFFVPCHGEREGAASFMCPSGAGGTSQGCCLLRQTPLV